MIELVFASNNPNKVREIQNLLGSDYKILSLRDLDPNCDIPETASTLEGNALQKARYVKQRFGYNCFADDTGLEVEALNGQPGVHSARYSGNLSNFNNENARTQANIDKLLANLKDKPNRKARFRTVIALIEGDKETLFEGIVEGEIDTQREGTDGFGYDPVFKPEGSERSFAQMGLDEKNKISHRARAMNKLVAYLQSK